MNVDNVIRRLAAAAPMVIIVDDMPLWKVVHAVRDEVGEMRYEAFVMDARTWSHIEMEASLLSPYVGNRWVVRRAKDVGALSGDGRLLIIPLPKSMARFVAETITAYEATIDGDRPEWRIEL